MHKNVTSASRRRPVEILTEGEVLALIRACSSAGELCGVLGGLTWQPLGTQGRRQRHVPRAAPERDL